MFALIGLSANAQWETVYYPNTNFLLPWLNAVAFHDFNNGFAVGRDDDGHGYNSRILKTTDNGTHWDTVYSAADTLAFSDVTFTNDTTAFAVAHREYCCSDTGLIAKTSDFGLTWTITPSHVGLNSISFPSANIGYTVGNSGTILKTIDAGTTWNPLNSGISVGLQSIYFINDTIGFACGGDTIMKTTNGGISWVIQSIMSYMGANKIYFPTDSVGYCKTIGCGDTIKFYKTVDQGNTWNLQSINTTTNCTESMFFTDKNTGYYVGQFYMGQTIDGGTTWIQQSSTAPSIGNSFYDNLMDVFMLNKDTGFAVGESQFYRTIIDGTTGIDKIFSQNNNILIYPNPVSNSMTINYNLSSSSNVLINVYDMLGNKIKEIANDRETSGQHSINWNASDVPQGIYLLQVIVDNKILNEKITVMK